MRSFSEERHSRTDQLLYSLPLSVGDLVMGKYFAMLSVFAIPCAVMCIYPLILSMYGTVFFLETYSAILAFFLLGAALIAIGMFMSSLTESQVISAVVCFGAVLLCYLMSGISGLIPSTSLASFIAFTVVNLLLCILVWYMTKNTVVACAVAFAIEIVILIVYLTNQVLFEGLINKALSALSLFDRLGSFVNGMFDLTSVVYYLSVMTIFVFFTCQAVEKRRWS
jgi:ABC-2 type transport system permease protein